MRKKYNLEVGKNSCYCLVRKWKICDRMKALAGGKIKNHLIMTQTLWDSEFNNNTNKHYEKLRTSIQEQNLILNSNPNINLKIDPYKISHDILCDVICDMNPIEFGNKASPTKMSHDILCDDICNMKPTKFDMKPTKFDNEASETTEDVNKPTILTSNVNNLPPKSDIISKRKCEFRAKNKKVDLKTEQRKRKKGMLKHNLTCSSNENLKTFWAQAGFKIGGPANPPEAKEKF